MHVLFAGTDSFACVVLQRLLALSSPSTRLVNRLDVLTSPDSVLKVRRTRSLVPSPVRLLAQSHGLQTFTPAQHELPTFSPHVDTSSPRVLLAASYPYFLPSALISRFSSSPSSSSPSHTSAHTLSASTNVAAALNVHPSLLPALRGAAPIQWAIARRLQETGVCLQTLSLDKFDHGDILATDTLRLGGAETYENLEQELAAKGADLVEQVLTDLPSHLERAEKQATEGASHAPKITRSHARAKWHKHSAADLEARSRAFANQHAIWTTLASEGDAVEVQLLDLGLVRAEDTLAQDARDALQGQIPGAATYDRVSRSLVVVCQGGEHLLGVQRVKQAGRKAVEAREWFNGLQHRSRATQVLRFV